MTKKRARFKQHPGRSAVPTMADGIKFPSKTEARVYEELKVEAIAEGAVLYRQCRYPLFSLAPDETGKPLYITIDFMLKYPDNTIRVIDAKSKTWQNREWRRGVKAFEGWYGIKVEHREGKKR